MSVSPQVSVVMSVYNGASTLDDTVQSVLAQTGVNLELIVVDDGSNDNTREKLNTIADSDSRVRVFTQVNSGLTVGLIRGCEMATGRYIARQDVGDSSLANRLYTQMIALDLDPELSFVSCWTEVVGPAKEFLSNSTGTGRASQPTQIISEKAMHGVIDGPAHHGSVMFRRDHYLAAGGYRSQFYFGQDWDLWYRLGELGKFQMIEKVMYQARVTPSSLSGTYREAQQQISKLSREMLLRRRKGAIEDDLLQQARNIRPRGTRPSSASSQAMGLYFIGEQLRRNGDVRAGGYLREAVQTSPTMLKAWLRLGQFWLTPKRGLTGA